ncbi:MAG: holo-ACP synthase [bacterium]
MICGTGIDLLDIDRMRKTLSKSDNAFIERVFTDEEIAYCRGGVSLSARSRCFAGRFCAKEAFLKALGTGLRDGIWWKDIEVMNDALGKPTVTLKNMASEILKEKHITHVHVSISHDRKTAAAVVVLERLSDG